jgi:hypothetical protein
MQSPLGVVDYGSCSAIPLDDNPKIAGEWRLLVLESAGGASGKPGSLTLTKPRSTALPDLLDMRDP